MTSTVSLLGSLVTELFLFHSYGPLHMNGASVYASEWKGMELALVETLLCVSTVPVTDAVLYLT